MDGPEIWENAASYLFTLGTANPIKAVVLNYMGMVYKRPIKFPFFSELDGVEHMIGEFEMDSNLRRDK